MVEPLGGMAHIWPYYAAAILGYLLGSIPFGLVLTRLAGFGDIRAVGSGNIGATNVLRTGNKLLAFFTLLLDGGKGALAVLIGLNFGQDIAVLAGLGAMVGHCFPIWLKFKGGKGAATFLGTLLAIAFPVGAACCLTWLLVAVVTRYSSMASMAAALTSPIYAFWLADVQRAEMAAIMAAIILFRHYGNIKRLLRGEESKIGGKSSPTSAATEAE